MTDITAGGFLKAKQEFNKCFEVKQSEIEKIHIDMGNCLMGQIAVDILLREPSARTLAVFHMTVDENEYNSIGIKSLLDAEGNDLLEEDDDLARWLEDLTCNYNGDYLVLLPTTIDLLAQVSTRPSVGGQ